MKFLHRGIVATFIALTLCLASGFANLSASATGYSPVTGATFNNPTGSHAEQYAIVDQLQSSINAAPRGSVIRMAFFSLSVQSFSDTLIAAHQRGVNVQLIMDDHDIRPQWTALVKELGSSTKRDSFAITCKNGCLSGQPGSVMHAKVYLFSTAGTAKQVVTVSSANPTTSQAKLAFNNAYTVVGDSTLYSTYRQYFIDMVAGSKGAYQPNYYRMVQSGGYATYLSPRPGDTASTDTYYSILSNVSCSGGTTIRIAMLMWTKARIDLAQKLWSLDNAGCNVEIITNAKNVEPEIMAALTKTGRKHGGPIVRNATKGEQYVHDKYMIINGNYAGTPKSKVVFTGSHNFTQSALRYNNDVILKIRNNAAYDAYNTNFSTLRTFATSK